MKKVISSLSLVTLMALGYSAHAQQNISVSDTAGLRSEYTSLYNELSDLNTQLKATQNNLEVYLLQPKAIDVINNQAANTGSKIGRTVSLVENTKKEYEHASRAYNQGLNNLHDKIFILSADISKKKQRLQQLSASSTL